MKKAGIIAAVVVVLAALGFGGYKAKQYYDFYKANSAEVYYRQAFEEAERLTGCKLYKTAEKPQDEEGNTVLYTLSDAESCGEERASFTVQVEHTDRLGLKFYEYKDLTPLMSRSFYAAGDIAVSAEGAVLTAADASADTAKYLSDLSGGIKLYTIEKLYKEEQISVKTAAGGAPLKAELEGLPFYYDLKEQPENDESIKAIRAALSEQLVRAEDKEGSKVTALTISKPFEIKDGEGLLALTASILSKKAAEGDAPQEYQRLIKLAKAEDGSWKEDSQLAPDASPEAFKTVTALIGEQTKEDIYVIPKVVVKKSPYYITVNRLMNTVTIYTQDDKGEYTVPVKAMVCSTGRAGHETPAGDFTVHNWKARWCYMVDGSYGQYATRFRDGGYLFHSICYTAKSTDTMMVDEYNLLGNYASLGCVRLQTADAKWIFDNCPAGTGVKIYDDPNPGPLGKPAKAVAEITAEMNNGWDPTDPAEGNPWRQ